MHISGVNQKPAFGWGGFDPVTRVKRPIDFKPSSLVINIDPNNITMQAIKHAYKKVERISLNGVGAVVLDLGNRKTMNPERFRDAMVKIAQMFQHIHEERTGNVTRISQACTITRPYSMNPHSDSHNYLMLGYMPYRPVAKQPHPQVFVYDATQFTLDFNEPKLSVNETGYYWMKAVPHDKQGKIRGVLQNTQAFPLSQHIYHTVFNEYYRFEAPLTPSRYRILILNDLQRQLPVFHGTKIPSGMPNRHIPLIAIDPVSATVPKTKEPPQTEEALLDKFKSNGNPVAV